MRVSELYKQVSGLGFENSLENDDRFYYAANRALLQVCSIRPAINTYIINHHPLANMIKSDTFQSIARTEDLCFEATGARAFYCEVDGNGVLYVEALKNGKWGLIGGPYTLSSHRVFTPCSDLIMKDGEFFAGPVRLRFSGEFLYFVRNVALFRHTYSRDKKDIPSYEPYTTYDIGALVDDFLGLSSPPIAGEEDRRRLGKGYDVVNGRKIMLPYDSPGTYEVLYKHKPKELVNEGEPAEDDMVIDLEEELCALLPNLIAAYVWAEDEPTLANYYLALYEKQAMDIERRNRNMTPASYVNVNGW